MSLPSGYVQVEYIESSGSQYIDTGYVPNQNTRIAAEMAYAVHTDETCGLFGSSQTNGLEFYNWGGEYVFCLNTTESRVSADPVNGKKMQIALSKEQAGIEIDGNVIDLSLDTVNAFTGTYALYIHCLNRDGKTQYFSNSRTYSFQIYESGTLVRDFVPCINESNAAGLYDTVNGVFYGNAGSGVFTAGPEAVLIPDPPGSLTAVGTDGTVRLSWTASDKAIGYRVYRNGMFLGVTENTAFTDTDTEAYGVYLYAVTAYNEAGESDGASVIVIVPGSADVLSDLITDRVQTDVTNRTKKGVYNAHDLNRAASAAAYVRALLVELGYLCGSDVRAEWQENEIPRRSAMDEHLASVTDLDVIRYAAEKVRLPASMDALTAEDANAIEAFLLSCGRAAERIPSAWMYCGEVGCGEI